MLPPVEPGQYTALRFPQRLVDAGIAPSTGSVGDSFDNAFAENLWSTLKIELICWPAATFATQAEAESALFRYIDGWYKIVAVSRAVVIFAAVPWVFLAKRFSRRAVLATCSNPLSTVGTNLILAICINANAEALVLGVKFGIDPEKLVDSVIEGVGFNHGMRKRYKEHVLKGDFGEQDLFSVDFMREDLALAFELADDLQVPLNFGALADQNYQAARAAGKAANYHQVGCTLLEDLWRQDTKRDPQPCHRLKDVPMRNGREVVRAVVRAEAGRSIDAAEAQALLEARGDELPRSMSVAPGCGRRPG
ncbi:MAG: hypothetical protein EOP24_38565 [Hyphomicrobiales bacterium]|nr:MAG: hypothetical protein EOP24_38565 [Hyphomicrobiales bacterium]